LKVLNEMFAIV